MNLDFSKHVNIPSHVLFRELQGESVLLNLESERYYGLDDIGTNIWAALSSSENIQSAFQALVNDYEVEPEILEGDLRHLLQDLIDQGLIEVI